MNVLSALSHAFHARSLSADPATVERRQQYAEALDAARRGPARPLNDPEAAAFDAQCRRVRESHYIDAPSSDVFHVC